MFIGLILVLMGGWYGVIGIVVGGGGAALFGLVSLIFHLLSNVTPKQTNGTLEFGVGMLITGSLIWIYNAWITGGGEGTFFFPLITLYLPAFVLGAIFTIIGLKKRKD